MTWKTYARQSVTMPQGITLERSRVDLNAFRIMCFVWRAPRGARPLPAARPGVLARGA